MSFTLFAVMEAALLASSLSLDSFTAGLAYGTNKTRIPFMSAQIINLICSAITGLSLFAGALLKPYLPSGLTLAVAFTFLFIIGFVKLLDSITKSIIRKHNNLHKKLDGSFLNFKFVLNLYANPEAADVDASKSISPSEAALLAVSLSLDGIAVGFSAALVNVNSLLVFSWSLITDLIFLYAGNFIGKKIASKTHLNLSWLSGAILICLAVSKLF